jgi:predicted amidohydrolase
MTQRPPPYTAAVVQLGREGLADENTLDRDIDRNARKMIRWIHFLNTETATPPRLIVFPFCALTGSRPRPVRAGKTPFRLDEPIHPALHQFIEVCRQYDCYVAFSVVDPLECLDGEFIATGIVLNGDGIVLRQPKFQVHGDYEREEKFSQYARFVAALGEERLNQVVDTPIGRLGSMLDRDLLIPEVGRQRARAGAEVVVHPSFNWFDVDMPFVEMRQSFAFQNCLFLLTANPAFERWTHEGKEEFHPSRGNSMITGPDGKILARCGEGEGFALATIDLQKAADARAGHGQVTLPIWQFYSKLYQE